MAKRVSVINFKGGVGKTTFSFHLATGLEKYHNARVLVVDVDHQSSLSLLFLDAARWQRELQAGRTVDNIFQHLTVNGHSLPGPEVIVKSPRNDYPNVDLIPASLHLDDTEIELAGSQTGNAITSEWTKRTLLCRWLEETGLDAQYDYIIVDCPPATKIVSQNAIALSHGYIVPVVPEAVMERGAPHLVDLIGSGIDAKLQLLAKFGDKHRLFVPSTRLVGLVITRIHRRPHDTLAISGASLERGSDQAIHPRRDWCWAVINRTCSGLRQGILFLGSSDPEYRKAGYCPAIPRCRFRNQGEN